MITTKMFKVSVLLMAVAIMFSACSGKKNDPKTVANNFLTAVQKQDYDAAKKYATKESEDMLNTMKSISTMGGDQKTEPKKIEVKDAKEDGDNATVTYTVEGEDGDQTLNLKKEDGDWKVVFDKSMMGGGETPDNGTTTPADTSMGAPTDTTTQK